MWFAEFKAKLFAQQPIPRFHYPLRRISSFVESLFGRVEITKPVSTRLYDGNVARLTARGDTEPDCGADATRSRSKWAAPWATLASDESVAKTYYRLRIATMSNPPVITV